MVSASQTLTKSVERTREQVEEAKKAVDAFKSKALHKWNLDLDTTRTSKDVEPDNRERCIRILQSLYWRDLDSAIWDIFNTQAIKIENRWSSRHEYKAGTISAQRQSELLGCLYRVLKEESEKFKDISRTPSSRHSVKIKETKVDDRPILFSAEFKRLREDTQDIQNLSKKPKPALSRPQLPGSRTSADESYSGVSVQNGELTSANTSFSSLFDRPSGVFSTQASSLDGSYDEHSRSQHASQSYDSSGMTYSACAPLSPSARVEKHIEPKEQELKDHLDGVFPQLPPSLRSSPWIVAYEVTRICLHTNVSLADVKPPKISSLHKYNDFWHFIQINPVFKGKPLPERSSREAWMSALTGAENGCYCISMSGSLQFEDSAEALFQFRLQPLRFQLSHRLGRRLGNHRFLELEVPQLSGQGLPNLLTDLGDRGLEIIIEWLVDTRHQLFGRTWTPFFNTKFKKKQIGETVNRVYLFAEDGNGLNVMSVDALLNFTRPTRENESQSYLKLFSRTVLAVSRNRATVELERDQIYDRDDILCNSEVMTDGAGRISPSLAQKVSRKLGLVFVPSGFQGRIGESKGFWSVDFADESRVDWLETYRSQRKWARRTIATGESEDLSYRTFEVVGHSGPLKSKALNEQMLPILMEQALDKDAMMNAVITLLKDGLKRELKDLRMAMNSRLLLLKWLHENKSNPSEKLTMGTIQYLGAFPKAEDQGLIMLLNGGFNPREEYYAQQLAKNLFKYKCDALADKVKVKVDKSASIFMIPDFFRILEENEVYLKFSKFDDKSSEVSGTRLFGKDILVARSPAHLVSDIQKVKVVAKLEFIDLEDVIIFPTKGNPSLAAKLSGGDYDGDRAWVCWEPSIVNNFKNAHVPLCPDLVKLEYIQKDSRTFAELVEGCQNPTSTFLKSALEFTMRRDTLGDCTNFKQMVCYEQKSVNKPEGRLLSTLLNSLVDQYKLGLTLTESNWDRLKKMEIKIQPRLPAYMDKKNKLKFDEYSTHIIDRIRSEASKTVHACLTEFHNSFKGSEGGLPHYWDATLTKQYQQCLGLGETNDEWKSLIHDLDADLAPLLAKWKTYWQKNLPKKPWEKPTGDFVGTIKQCYAIFQQIQPHKDTALAQSLLLPDPGDPAQSEWALLRASALVDKYRKAQEFSKFAWHMCGIQLVKLKARFGGFPLVHTVVSSQYVALKHDSSYIKRFESSKDAATTFEDWVSDVEDDEDADE